MLLVSGRGKLHNALAIERDLEDPQVGTKVFDRFTVGAVPNSKTDWRDEELADSSSG